MPRDRVIKLKIRKDQTGNYALDNQSAARNTRRETFHTNTDARPIPAARPVTSEHPVAHRKVKIGLQRPGPKASRICPPESRTVIVAKAQNCQISTQPRPSGSSLYYVLITPNPTVASSFRFRYTRPHHGPCRQTETTALGNNTNRDTNTGLKISV
ncbi:hypothetical protein PG993_002382 [Apiospora rasikravindrae]|uniref:Uncharacterized protein n=1 Tax=Apiospora rasikravindrae TaxID=990691 RepID=A0ABR1TWN6_9PEZI